jgi:hypothetical protein
MTARRTRTLDVASEFALRPPARTLGSKVAKIAVYEAPYNHDPAAQRAWTEYIRRLGEALADGRGGDAVALVMQSVDIRPEQITGVRQAPF